MVKASGLNNIDIDQHPNPLMSVEEETEMNKSMEMTVNNVDSESSGNELDMEEMYGSETDAESQISKEVGNPPENCSAVPQYAIDKFMKQLERIHAEHDEELKEMEKTHAKHMEEMKEKLKAVTHMSKRGPRSNDVANHDKCLAQQRQLEKEFNKQLQEKDNRITELVEMSKTLTKQVEELTAESDGLNQTIQAR